MNPSELLALASKIDRAAEILDDLKDDHYAAMKEAVDSQTIKEVESGTVFTRADGLSWLVDSDRGLWNNNTGERIAVRTMRSNRHIQEYLAEQNKDAHPSYYVTS